MNDGHPFGDRLNDAVMIQLNSLYGTIALVAQPTQQTTVSTTEIENAAPLPDLVHDEPISQSGGGVGKRVAGHGGRLMV